MTIHVHELRGCAPSPLAHYLKALAILRLISEQTDANARGWWRDEAFCLATRLSGDELIRFFLEEYRPTPVLSPWNAGSGFYFREGKSGEKDPVTRKLIKTGVRDAPTEATRAMEMLIASSSPRLAEYRACACAARTIVRELGFSSAPKDTDKPALIAALRSRLARTGVAWLDASVSSLGDEFACAPLLGSGGNDGNEDFSNNFLQRVLSLIADKPGTELIRGALFGHTVVGALGIVAGQFQPGANGGNNAGIGFKGQPPANAWDYVLAMEGALAFAGSSSRRLETSPAGASFPFAVRVDPAGYGSAADKDRDDSRLEVWLPLWNMPSTNGEVRALLAEGRARLERTDAGTTLEFARAVANLGTSRGVVSFERTAFLTRNGNMHYSVPTGRWNAGSMPREDLLTDVEKWVERFHRAAREKGASTSLSAVARRIDEAILAVCRTRSQPQRWQELLTALGEGETALLSTPRSAGDAKKGLAPLSLLRPSWLDAANDGTVEFRLAVALAAQSAVFRNSDGEVLGGVRGHWMPLDRSRASHHPARFATGASGLATDPDVVCSGRDLERDCLALLKRRVQLAATLTTRSLGLVGLAGCGASLSDVMAFLDRSVDDARVLALARPLMAVRWWSERSPLERPPPTPPDAAYAILRIVHAGGPLRRNGDDVEVRLDTEPLARLIARDVAGAVAVSLRRLRASGLTPKLRVVGADPSRAHRLAASLAFPLRPADTRLCADLVTKPHAAEFQPEEE
jgi:CRISPR-associated protein Csx17